MATRKIETPEGLVTAAIAAAQSAINATQKARGFSKTFTAKVLALGCYSTTDAAKAAETLGKGLEALGTGGKGYASNAKRILAAGQTATGTAVYTISDGNGGTAQATVTMTIAAGSVATIPVVLWRIRQGPPLPPVDRCDRGTRNAK